MPFPFPEAMGMREAQPCPAGAEYTLSLVRLIDAVPYEGLCFRNDASLLYPQYFCWSHTEPV